MMKSINGRVWKAIPRLAILCFLLLTAIMNGKSSASGAQWDETPAVTTFEELRNAIQSASDGETILIGGDITMTGTITVNKSVVIATEQHASLLSASSRHFIVNGGKVTLTFDNVTLDGNGTGGGVITNAALLTLVNPDITRCRALQGGGVLFNGSLTVVGGSISGNDGGASFGGYGGGISGNGANEKTLIITGGAVIGNNKAGAHGGGIYCGDNCRVIIEDSSVVHNEAGLSNWGLGGGICSHASNVLSQSSIVISNSLIGGNQAVANSSQAGGIYLNYNYTLDLMDGAVIGGNESGGMGGGVVINAGAVMNIHAGAEVTGNVSRGSCGGVMVYGESGMAVLNILGGVIGGNKSATNGGGVYGYMNSVITVRDEENEAPVIYNNTSGKNGGGIYAYGDAAIIDIAGASIEGNTAAEDGGGVYIPRLANLTISHSSMSGNKSKQGCRWSLGTGYAEEHFNADSETHWMNITNTSFSTPYDNAYNNDDVVYAYAAPQPVLYTLQFVNDGAPVAEQTLAKGEKASKPKDPARERYNFTGWYKDEKLESLWNFSDEVMPDADVTLYAGWEAISYVVSFYDDYPGGALIGAVTVTAPAKSAADAGGLPVVPNRSSGRFEGWYTVGNNVWTAFDVNAVVTGDVKAYARWTPLYSITFNSNGGTLVAAQTGLAAGQKVPRPEDPDREGYDFGGWYQDNGTFSEEWDFAVEVLSGDITLYALWTEVVLTLEPPPTLTPTPPPTDEPAVTPRNDDILTKTEEIPDETGVTWNAVSTPTPIPPEATAAITATPVATAGPAETAGASATTAADINPPPTPSPAETEPAPPENTDYPVNEPLYTETGIGEGGNIETTDPLLQDEALPPPLYTDHAVVALSAAGSGDVPVFMELTTSGTPYGIWRNNGNAGLVLNTLVPQDDGTFIEFDISGVPLGAWAQDDAGVWVFEAFAVLSAFDMPATGEISYPWVLSMSGLALAAAGEVLRRRKKK